MTQNMQRYFGFRVKVSDFLEPSDYKLIRNKVIEFLEKGNIDTTRYKIYLHQLVLEADSSHFGVGGGLSERISKVLLRFSINQKQRLSGDIEFVNYRFNRELNEDVGHYYLPYEIGYTIPSTFFKDRQWFQNVLVTLVRVGMREDHKKIKVKVSVEPTTEFAERLYRSTKSDSSTELDISFKRVVEFNRQTKLFVHPTNSTKEIIMSEEETSKSHSTITVNGPVGTLISESPYSSAYGTATVLNSPDLLEHVVKELKTLHSSIQSDSTDKVSRKDIGVIEGVIAEAPNNPDALKRLMSIGKWLLERAEKIGLSLLTALLKGQLGL
jgi:hypothetical protein